MTQQEELEKLYAKEKTYKVPKNPKEGQVQATIVCKPLSLEDMSYLEFNEGDSPDKIAKAAANLFSKSFGITIEQANKLSFEYMEELLDIVTDTNSLKGKEAKKMDNLKDFMKQKEELIKQKNEKSDKRTEG